MFAVTCCQGSARGANTIRVIYLTLGHLQGRTRGLSAFITTGNDLDFFQ